MQRSHLVIAAIGLVVVLGGLIALGSRVLDRDRRAIHAEYARDKMHRLDQAALDLGNDIEKIGEDLQLAAALAAQAGSPEVRERELHAIAAITREYLAIEAQAADGTVLAQVTDPASASPAIARAAPTLAATIAAARAEPGVFLTSRPLGDLDLDRPESWYRVCARSDVGTGLVVAIVVDMGPLLARLKLLEDPASALLVLGVHGLPAPSSDPTLAAAARRVAAGDRASPGLARLLDEVRGRERAMVTIGAAEAARLGLPRETAVGVTVPVQVEGGEPWSIALVSSTASLRDQERTLVRRMALGGAVIALLLISLSAYFVWNARRAAALHERVRQADRFARAEKLATAGQLAAGIAHEIGTPLGIIRGRAEVAVARLGSEHPQAHGQQVIIDQIDHVSRLISQLLDYVRPQAPLVQPVDAAAALDAVANLLAAEAGKRGITMTTDGAADLPPLRADPGQLQQVLVNLTMNALDACLRGGKVELRARRAADDRHLVLEVVDDGVGVPAESRAQIFDPFFTTKKRGQGTGLGLWVVAQLVRRHEGELELDSRPGAGTTVRITWPAHDAREERQA
ncbi:MAG TPA: ATP-binding protein [Kofleriaceae bacterium]|nr:ATP-binding protein [Kofleriaceae bacterium]